MAKTDTISISDFAHKLAETHDLTVAKSKAIIDQLRDLIVSSITDGRRVAIFGLGAFEARATKEKVGRNPKTGEQIRIPAGRRVAFKPAKGLKEGVK